MALNAADVNAKVDTFFDTIASKIGGDIVGKALPLVGKLVDIPGGSAALDPFGYLKTQVHNAINSAAGVDVAQAIANAVNNLNIPDVHAVKTPAGGVDITFLASKTINTGTAILDVGANLGTVGSFLDFKVNAGASFTAAVDATLSFGADGSISLKNQANPEVDVKVSSDFSVVNLSADLGVANVKFNDADPSAPELNADFGLDFKLDVNGNFTVDPKLSGAAKLDLNFASTDILKAYLPNVKGEFIVGFGIADGVFQAPAISVDHLKVDLKSYLGIVSDTFNDINKLFTTGPFGTMVDLATAPIPALDSLAHKFFLMSTLDHVGSLTGGADGVLTIGDLAVTANPGLQEQVGLWYQVLKLVSMIRKIDDAANAGEIDFGGGSLIGGMTVPNQDPAAIVNDLKAKLVGLVPPEVFDFLTDIDISGLPGISAAAVAPSKGFEFGLFEHPEKILDILLSNKAVDLVKYDVPAFTFDQAYGGFFPVLGPLGFLLEGTLKAKFDVDVGYDTQGIIDGNLLNGFYVSTALASAPGEPIRTNWDNPKALQYLPVGSLATSIAGGAGVGFAGSSITVNARFGFGLYAYFEAADMDGKYRPVADGFECIFDPIGGQADVSLNITIKVGFGPFSVKKNIPLASANLGDFTIFECPPATIVASPQAPGLATLVGLDLLLNVGDPDRADQRKLMDDHGNISGQIRVVDNPNTPEDESLNETYVIGRARDVADKDASPSNSSPPQIVDGKLDVYAFGFTQRVDQPTLIRANFKNGDDMLVIQSDVIVNSDIFAGNGNDTLIGGGGSDILRGEGNEDVLAGNDGNDQLFGGEGDDQLDGGKGADRLDGGNGFDTVDYSKANQASHKGVTVTITLAGEVFGRGDEADGDVLVGIESVIGTDFDDDLRAGYGVTQNLVFDGGNGKDILIGGKGEDLLLGGADADHINGDDAIRADGKPAYDGTSYITSWGAVDVDLSRIQQFNGDAQGDRLFNLEAVEGSVNSDTLRGNNVANLLFGNDGDDTLEGRGGRDTVSGDYGNDLIYSNADGDTLDGGAGHDTLSYVNSGVAVAVDLGASQKNVGGVISFVPGAAPDSIVMVDVPGVGGRGRSSFEDLIGTGFSDTLVGDIGDNRIEGRSGDDVVEGDAGFDILVGGLGADRLIGDAGIDWIYYTQSFEGVTVDIRNNIGIGGEAQGDRYETVENILGSTYADRLSGSDIDNIIDPFISGRTVTETVEGYLGTDTLRVNYSVIGADIGRGIIGGFNVGATPTTSGSLVRTTLSGAATLDTVNFSGIEQLDLVGTRQNDTIRGGAGNDSIITLGGNDTIFSGLGADKVYAGSGNDVVTYGNDSLLNLSFAGGNRPFFLDGGSGIDTLSVSLSLNGSDISLVGSAPGVQFNGTNLSLPNGIGIKNFEIFRDVYTGEGWDYLGQRGFVDNRFITGGGSDDIAPGFGTDYVDAGGENSSTHYSDGQEPGDRLILDYSTYTGATGVVGTATRIANSDSAGNRSTAGTYRAGADVNLTFTDIERMDVTGSSHGDYITGSFARETFSDSFNFTRYGDDGLSGGNGNDVIIGYTGSDYLYGDDGNDTLVGADPNQVAVDASNNGYDPYESDYLTGGSGGDTFVLGTSGGFLYGSYPYSNSGGGGNSDFYGNRGIISDFNPTENDRIQLYGSAADYETIESFGNTYIYRVFPQSQLGPPIPHELIGEVGGFTGFNLNASYVVYANANNAGVSLAPGAQSDSPSAGRSFAAAAPASAASPSLTSVGGFSVTQTDDASALKLAFDGTGGAGTTLTLSGSSDAFGTFTGDPFGLGKGIILSTGQVEDLPGANTAISGGVNVTSVPLTFTKIGSTGGVDYYRASLTDIGVDLRSITLKDSNTELSGAGGVASGFDLDAIVISDNMLTSVSSADDLNFMFKYNVFDYSSAGVTITPGYQSVPNNGFDYGPDLQGSINGLINGDFASLDRFDSGYLSLGRGGSVGFDLTSSLPATGPLYVYVAEVGANGENLVGTINASPDTIQPTGDLSTDLGAEGLDGDTTSLTYTFTPKAGDNAFSIDAVLFSEELPEYDGTSLTDLFSVRLNGIEIGALSNRAALSIKDLVYSGSNDLILNPVGTGPLSSIIKADAYTRTLTFSGAVDPGVVNVLTIEVRDGRDAFLDSGLLLKDGSFKTFKAPELTVEVTGPAGGTGGTNGNNGNDGTIYLGTPTEVTITPPVNPTGYPVTVTVISYPNVTIDGRPPGEEHTYTFNQNDPPIVISVSAVPGTTIDDTATIRYDVTGGGLDEQDPAPQVFGFAQSTNRAPDIPTPAGEIRVSENTTAVIKVVATDPDSGQVLTYSIDGGADKDLFKIDPTTGVLAFKVAPDFENPTDVGLDNVYDVVVGVKDNGAPAKSDSQAYAVRVTDAAESSTLVVKFVSESSSYKNAMGWYNTETLAGGILFGSIEAEGRHPTVTPGVSSASFTVNSADVGKIGFFLIPDGAGICRNDDGLSGPVKIIKLSNGSWAVASVDSNGNVATGYGGKPIIIEGAGAKALFTEVSKNAGGVDYASSKAGSQQTAATLAGDTADGPTGLLAWEDLAAKRNSNGSYGKPGDADYNDDVFNVIEIKGLTVNGDDTANALGGGDANDVINGFGGNDTLTGGAGDDKLSGGAGADRMIGGAGNDLYLVDDAGDVVDEAALGSNGTDTVQSSITFSLSDATHAKGSIENLTLVGAAAINATGNLLANVLIGNSAANRLDGQGGADIMKGLGGDDIYVVDNSGDIVDESVTGSGGADTVQSSVTFSLDNSLRAKGAIENLTLTGSSAINATGNTLANILIGNSAANTLDGGAGADRMEGKSGNDTYVVTVGDVVVEASNAGTDLVKSSISYTLSDNVENLTLTGSAAINATGNTLANILIGNNAANTLNGGTGADTMRGLGGNDIYIVDNAGDVVDESVFGSGGTDTVKSSVSFNLADSSVAKGLIENVTLTGSSAISATGNGLANMIAGNGASNILTGGSGADTFRFDTLLGASNIDRITDFTFGDKISLENGVFKGLTQTGGMASGAFYAAAGATSAHDLDDRIIYNTSTGRLYYDADGTAPAGAASIEFALLQTKPILSHLDFLIT